MKTERRPDNKAGSQMHMQAFRRPACQYSRKIEALISLGIAPSGFFHENVLVVCMINLSLHRV
jgi:hypothetical protein